MSYFAFFRTLAGLSPLGVRGLTAVCIFVNLLYLTSPLYMMHIYDTVIGANSEVNLYAISGIALFCYLMFYFFDLARSKLLIAISPQIESSFERHSANAIQQDCGDSGGFTKTRINIDQLSQFSLSPAIVSFYDLPFVPVFIALGFVIHPYLGLIGVIGALILITITLLYGQQSDRILSNFDFLRKKEAQFGKAVLAQREFIKISYDQSSILRDWLFTRKKAHETQLGAASIVNTGHSLTKTLRFIIQSSVLGTGAFLVINQSLSPGAIIAASIVLSRALMPIEQSIAARRMLFSAKESLEELTKLEQVKEDTPAIKIATESEGINNGSLVASSLTFRYKKQNTALLNKLSFSVPEGNICVITGPNGCGKTSLLRCLLGLLPLERGNVSIGNILMLEGSIERFSRDIKYLAQHNELFPVSIRNNIKWNSENEKDRNDVVDICEKLGFHDDILSLENGYDTVPFDEDGCHLSSGVIQKISLARTLVNSPSIVFLDEPLQYLDSQSVIAFKKTIKDMKALGKTIIMVTHDQRIIDDSDLILMFHPIAGQIFGPTKDLLAKLIEIESPRSQMGKL